MGAILNICAIVWLIGEIAIWRGDKQSSGGSERQDKGSRSYAIIAVIIGMGASSVASTFMPFLGIYRLAFFVLGIATMVAGIALRRWAVVTLGRFFNSKVVIQEGHKVVDSGPYRYVRNPSYTGLIITAVGYGIGCGSMVSIAIMFIVPLIGIVNRIFVEEEALLKGLGEDYTLYMKKVRYRLFPYIW
jgi:protein-S-isoprenylcysteine O-methyltransferase Ste14